MQTQIARRPTLPAIVTAAGGVILVIGSFLPWARISLGRALGGLSQSVAGTSGSDGKLTLVCGIVAAIAGVVLWIGTSSSLVKWMAVLAVVAGLVGGGLSLYDISRKGDIDKEFLSAVRASVGAQGPALSDEQLRQILDRLGVEFSLGIGIYVALAGGIVALIGGAMGLVARRPEPVAGGYPATPGHPGFGPPPTPAPAGPTAPPSPPAAPPPAPPETEPSPPPPPPHSRPGEEEGRPT